MLCNIEYDNIEVLYKKDSLNTDVPIGITCTLQLVFCFCFCFFVADMHLILMSFLFFDITDVSGAWGTTE